MHTITIPNLTDFEADHVAEILSEYKRKMLAKKLEAMAEDHQDGGGRAEWFDDHLEWHESIMAKIRWTKMTEPLEIHADLDEALIEFWHSDEIRPFAKVFADELRVYEEYIEVYSRDYSYPILVVKEYDWWREAE